MNAMKPTSEYF